MSISKTLIKHPVSYMNFGRSISYKYGLVVHEMFPVLTLEFGSEGKEICHIWLLILEIVSGMTDQGRVNYDSLT